MPKSQPPGRVLEPDEVNELLKAGDWSLRYTDPVTAYVSSSGEVLSVVGSGRGRIWPSVDVYESFWKKSERKETHILEGRLPNASRMPVIARETYLKLAQLLGVDVSVLDRSVPSLLIVEQGVVKAGAQRCLEADIFEPLVAYAGEVVREASRGAWKVTTWDGVIDPRVVGADGHEYLVARAVYEALEEPEQTGGLRAVIAGELGSAKLHR